MFLSSTIPASFHGRALDFDICHLVNIRHSSVHISCLRQTDLSDSRHNISSRAGLKCHLSMACAQSSPYHKSHFQLASNKSKMRSRKARKARRCGKSASFSEVSEVSPSRRAEGPFNNRIPQPSCRAHVLVFKLIGSTDGDAKGLAKYIPANS